MKLVEDRAPLRRLCDVPLKPKGGEAPTALYYLSRHAESVAAACQFHELSRGEKLYIVVVEGLS
jgi:hypothetical protein